MMSHNIKEDSMFKFKQASVHGAEMAGQWAALQEGGMERWTGIRNDCQTWGEAEKKKKSGKVR